MNGAQTTALQLLSGQGSDLAGDQHDLLESYRFRLSLWAGLCTKNRLRSSRRAGIEARFNRYETVRYARSFRANR